MWDYGMLLFHHPESSAAQPDSGDLTRVPDPSFVVWHRRFHKLMNHILCHMCPFLTKFIHDSSSLKSFIMYADQQFFAWHKMIALYCLLSHGPTCDMCHALFLYLMMMLSARDKIQVIPSSVMYVHTYLCIYISYCICWIRAMIMYQLET